MRPLSPDELQDIIDYIAGELSPETHGARQRWIEADVDRLAFAERLRESRQAMRDARSIRTDASRMAQRLVDQVAHKPRTSRNLETLGLHRWTSVGPHFATPGPRIGTLTVRLAVALFCMVVATLATLRHRDGLPHRTSTMVYATRSGEQATIHLTDGSQVILGPRSALRIARNMPRTVVLQGEGYFDVAGTFGVPFRVQAGAIMATVLGTRFTMRRYRADPALQIAVVTGKVAIRTVRGTSALTAGNVAFATDSNVVMTSEGASPPSWLQGELVFDNTPVPEMLATIGRWYGYTFHVTDARIAQRNVTTVLRINQREETFAAIRQQLNVTMTFDGSIVTLSPASRDQRRIIRLRQSLSSSLHEVGK